MAYPRRVSYDSGRPALQWRCNLYDMLKPQSLIILSLLPFALMRLFHLPFESYFLGLGLVITFWLLQISLVVRARTKAARQCTTIVDDQGVTDTTPDGSRVFTWSDIKNIEMFADDIYFAFNFGAIFVPREAFQDRAEAESFCRHAKDLWEKARLKPAA